MKDIKKVLLRHVNENEEGIIRFAQDLVRTPSVTGEELEVAKIIKEKVEELGIKAKLISHGKNRASVVATIEGTNRKPGLLFNGHIDTVPVGAVKWDHDPFGGEIVENKIYGRGSSDMKSSIAAMVYAMASIAQSDIELSGDLILAATAGEEVDSIGAKEVLNLDLMKNVKNILIGEPSNLDIIVAEKGALWIKLITKGKTSHASMPEFGINAIDNMLLLLNTCRPEVEKILKNSTHPLLGQGTFTLSTINGGVKTNVVPDFCEATIDMRTLPVHSHEEIIEVFKNNIQKLSSSCEDFLAEIEIINDRGPYEISPDAPIVQTLRKSITEVKGSEPKICGVAFYTDASVFNKACDSIVVCGPGRPELAHQPNEYVEIPKLIDATKIYSFFAYNMLKL